MIGGDVIVSLAGEPVASADDLNLILEDKRPGEEVGIIYYREGEKIESRVHLIGQDSSRTFRF